MVLQESIPASAGNPQSNDQSWSGQSAEELMKIVGRGLQGGDLFRAAQIELERRAAEKRRLAEQAAEADRRRTVRTRRIILVSCVLAVFAVVTAVLALS